MSNEIKDCREPLAYSTTTWFPVFHCINLITEPLNSDEKDIIRSALRLAAKDTYFAKDYVLALTSVSHRTSNQILGRG